LFGFMCLAAVGVGVRQWQGDRGQPPSAAVPATTSAVPAGGGAAIPMPEMAPDAPPIEPVALIEVPQEEVVTEKAPEVEAVSDIVARIEARLSASPHEASDALVAYADTYAEERRPDVAEALLGRALKRNDRNARAAAHMAELRLGQDNLEGAEGWAAQAVTLGPRRVSYRLLYGDILSKRGRRREARRQWRKALRLNPKSERAAARIGR
jgi:tetratricopeptide (TPR) repeat protein